MKTILTTILATLILLSCSSQLRLDTAKYAIFNDKNSVSRYFNNCKAASLTEIEIIEIESLLTNRIYDYNKSQIKYYKALNKKINLNLDFAKDTIVLDKYKRQIVSVTNRRGDKEVWINCFRPFSNTQFDYWKKQIVFVNDGGNYFFNIKINVTRKKCYYLYVNAVA